MTTLHTYSDGAVLRRMTAKELIRIPTWKGNRILDAEHARKIQQAIGTRIQSLDNGYRIVKYHEEDTAGRPVLQSYIIDGQHRVHILRDHYDNSLCEPDFDVTVTEKTVDSESDAIMYFNALNNVKPQCWKTDPNLLVNRYIAELELRINTKKRQPLIRPSNTHRPYLSSERLREALKSYADNLTETGAKDFATNAIAINQSLIKDIALKLAIHPEQKDAAMLDKARGMGFMLGVVNPIEWIGRIL